MVQKNVSSHVAHLKRVRPPPPPPRLLLPSLVPRAIPRERTNRIGQSGATASHSTSLFSLFVRPIKGSVTDLYARAPSLPQEAAERGLLKKKHAWERLKVGKTWRDGEGEEDETYYDGEQDTPEVRLQKRREELSRTVVPTLLLVSKKNVHKSAVYRNRCRTRFNAAFRTALESKMFRSGDELAQGHAYIFSIRREVHDAPMLTVVEEVTRALQAIKRKLRSS
ncbi:hypothetical protein FA10DRAFT_263735 [Acaromyces ingoldii]|uniref:Uncharacterized protein n=1 Tax=Acaromyces ingoldii TaxID=215250 RepID=A0A316YUV1_9BASI|nr:hypothetical protein FA10DRAFT_263735 [Acaromyces ingoldii]PWN93021.1 hypothetical protein FA10DRAFT_263735 [Acaromyces ingoldii]